MSRCFRLSDIVKARVLTVGDGAVYPLSTAENELGVIQATSEAGGAMLPVSWQEMVCPFTHRKEPRKVAKPTDAEVTA